MDTSSDFCHETPVTDELHLSDDALFDSFKRHFKNVPTQRPFNELETFIQTLESHNMSFEKYSSIDNYPEHISAINSLIELKKTQKKSEQPILTTNVNFGNQSDFIHWWRDCGFALHDTNPTSMYILINSIKLLSNSINLSLDKFLNSSLDDLFEEKKFLFACFHNAFYDTPNSIREKAYVCVHSKQCQMRKANRIIDVCTCDYIK